jgi:glycosyltransferase involved in cell wall biosynthesis
MTLNAGSSSAMQATEPPDLSTPNPPKSPISVFIPAKNEERNIVDCIKSLQWADEIVVVDSNSTDRTCELAEALGARVVHFCWKPGALKKKNWTLENFPFRNDWIFIIDADERVTPSLAPEIAKAARQSEISGYYVNRRFYFLGKWIRHAGYFPSWNLRLFRKGAARYEFIPDHSNSSGDNEVHEHMILEGTSARLQEPMEHYAYPDISTFLEKHNRYSSWEASCRGAVELMQHAETGGLETIVNLKRHLKMLARTLPFPHWVRFAYHYFFRLGILDGTAGYLFCHLLAEYEFQIWAKRIELNHRANAFNASR